MRAGGKKNMALRGVIPALITPLHKDGSLHETYVEKQVSYLSRAGVHGFLINGTTGEGPFLSLSESKRMIELTRTASGGSPFICVGCLLPSTQQVIEGIRALAPLKPDFVAVTTPYYFEVTQQEMIWHFREISRRSPFPVVAYNIPQFTHNKLGLDALIEVSRLGNVVGLKDSSGDFETFSCAILQGGRRDFAWMMGEDSLDREALKIGARGIVTGLGNVWIEPYIEMFRCAENGDLRGLREWQAKVDRLQGIVRAAGDRLIPAIKAATFLLGRSERWLKPPISPVSEEELVRLSKVLRGLGLLEG